MHSMAGRIMTKQDKQIWHCAVKNTTTDKAKWYYHLFYDFDGIHLSYNDVDWIVKLMKAREISFILRKSLHGYHLIGLTPLDSSKWGLLFSIFQNTYPTYHDGQAIRITKKEVGEFIIVAENYDFPFAGNLLKLFKKFDMEHVIDGAGNGGMIRELWYVLLYYTVNKKNVMNKQVISTIGAKK